MLILNCYTKIPTEVGIRAMLSLGLIINDNLIKNFCQEYNYFGVLDRILTTAVILYEAH